MTRTPSIAIGLASLLFAGFLLTVSLHGQDVPPPPPPPPPPPVGVRGGEPPMPLRPSSVGTASVSGMVVSADAAAPPIRRARVMLTIVEESRALIAITDDAGKFAFRDLPSGRVTLTVTKAGFVRQPYGAESHRGQPVPIVIGPGQAVDGVTARLTRGSVISGRVTDASGTGVPGAVVMVGERRVVNGQLTLSPGPTSGPFNQTDDRGVYRIYGLPAGSYVVGVTQSVGGARPAVRLTTDADVRWATGPQSADPAPAARPMLYSTTFYPGTTDPAAAGVLTLAGGEERNGVDVAFQWMPSSSLSGTVTRADGQPAATVQVHAFREDAIATQNLGILSLSLLRPTMVANGKFSVTGLSPGVYSVIARASSQATDPTAPAAARPAGPIVNDLWAEAKVTVSGSDISNLSLVLHPGMSLSGRLQFESSSAAVPDLTRVNINLSPPPTNTVSIGVPPVQGQADATFTARGVAPGRYLVNANAPGSTGNSPTWMVKSITVGGRDVMDSPLEVAPQQDVSDIVITFTDRVTELSGRIVDAAGQPVPQYYVGVFPVDQSQWRRNSRWLRAPLRPGTDGRFRMVGLPPGDYFLAALTEFDPNDWFTPTFLEQVAPGAIRVALGEGEKKTQDIRLR